MSISFFFSSPFWSPNSPIIFISVIIVFLLIFLFNSFYVFLLIIILSRIFYRTQNIGYIRLIKYAWLICFNISASVGICNLGDYSHLTGLDPSNIFLFCVLVFFLGHWLLSQAVHMGKCRPSQPQWIQGTRDRWASGTRALTSENYIQLLLTPKTTLLGRSSSFVP